MVNQDDNKDVPDILFDMLIGSQMHKENDDHVYENVKVDTIIANDGVVDNHDHEVEYMETMCKDVINKDENF